MRLILILILASIIPFKILLSDTLYVDINGTQQYTNIQAAINATQNGDIVLVYPGTYFENINYNGKNISVASLNLTTNDPAYINQTIIDGNQNGSCVQVNYGETDAVIHGFTVRNGSGTHLAFSKLFDGGGVFIENSNLKISNCIIKNNEVTASGGGCFCRNSVLTLSKVTINNNHAYRFGGGICLVSGSSIIFDTINLCNIYLNYSICGGEVFKSHVCPPLHIVVDTFTVINPDIHYIFSNNQYGYPQYDITWEIQHGKVEAVNSDLYVSPQGDNSNNGLSADEPLKNICFALTKIVSDSLHPNTIYLADGIYSPSATVEKYPCSLRSYVSITGESRDYTILDADGIIHILQGNVYTDNYSIKHITLRNGNGNVNSTLGYGALITLENHNAVYEDILVTENIGYTASSIRISRSNNSLLKDIEFYKNHGGKTFRAATGYIPGGPPFTADTVRVVNCIFRENLPDYDTTVIFGGGADIMGMQSMRDSITCYFINCEFIDNLNIAPAPYKSSCALAATDGSKVYLVNSTIGNNTTTNPYGACVGLTYSSSLIIYNSILYGNVPAEIYIASDLSWEDCSLEIYNSLISGGEAGIRVYDPYHTVYYDSTNIDLDPLWDTSGTYPYALTAASPCIDAGTLDLPAHIQLPDTDLAGNPRISGGGIDMGAYEYFYVGLPELPQKKPQPLLKVAPNPFNYGTYISYITKESGHIKIEVYDMYGRKVITLMDVKQLTGSGKIYWDGTNDYGQKLPPGTYIINLIINDKIKESVKVIKK